MMEKLPNWPQIEADVQDGYESGGDVSLTISGLQHFVDSVVSELASLDRRLAQMRQQRWVG